MIKDNIQSVTYKYQISVIVATYNPIFEKLFETLLSIVNQKGIVFEIVVTDDGSKKNYFEEIRAFFNEKDFKNYKLVSNVLNKGTVENMLSGIKMAEGKYVKGISPGDQLYNNCVLKEWIDYMEMNHVAWSFSDAVYYKRKDNKNCIIRGTAYPTNLNPYLKKNVNKCRWNYVVLGDIALGATMLCERELQLEYIKKIVGKVIYAEDNIWRLMMFDGYIGCYFPKSTILYEYGTGISTTNNSEWEYRLKKDWECATEILLNPKGITDDFQKKMIYACEKKKSYEKIFVKGKIESWFMKKFCKRMTNVNIPQ